MPQLDQWDACTAAPEFHRILVENDYVRTLETIVHPGQTVPMHTHIWSGVAIIISWSHMVRRDEQGNITFDSRETDMQKQPGETSWMEPLPLHTLENVGDGMIHVVAVELKS